MEIYRVSFIGHREVENFQLIEEQIEEIVRDLIYNKEYVEFYVGRNGEFDIMVASVIKKRKGIMEKRIVRLCWFCHIRLPIWI